VNQLAEPAMARGPTSTEHVHNASLMRKFSRIAVGGFGRQIAVFAVNGYLAWTLSKDVFGTFTCAYGSLMVTIGLADFGLRQVGWREVARNPQRIASIVDEIVAARLVTTLIGMAGFLACAGMYCRHPQDWIIFLAFSPGLLFNMTSFDFPFMGQDRVATINKSSTVAYAYYVLASLLTVGGDSTAWLAAFHFVVAHAIFVALLHKEYRRMVGPLRPLFRPRVILGYYKLSWPLGLNFFIFRLTTHYPVLLLGLIVSSAAVAEYRVAELFYSLFASLGLYLGSSTFTTFASYGKDGNRDIAHSVEIAVRTILLGLMPVGFLFATLLPTVLAWWLNETSPMAALTCFFLGISLPLGVATRYLKTCLPSIGLNAQLLSVNVASLALGVGAGAWLIRVVGPPGIAASVLVSDVCGLAMLLGLLKRRSSLRIAPAIAAASGVGGVWAALYVTSMALSPSPWLRVLVPLVVATPLTLWIAAIPHRAAFTTSAAAAVRPAVDTQLLRKTA
jgi:O-antigen/teichoic acid export membrane protein